MYYVIDKSDKLSIFDDNKTNLEITRKYMPQLEGQYTLETDIVTSEELHRYPNKVIVDDINIEIEVPEYDEEGNPIGYHTETITVKGLVPNRNWEAEYSAKERERISKLSLTKREVFLALYKDKGITPEDIKSQITNPEALIEFEYANDYYRGNPLIDAIGTALGYTTEELDYLFENKELPIKELVEE